MALRALPPQSARRAQDGWMVFRVLDKAGIYLGDVIHLLYACGSGATDGRAGVPCFLDRCWRRFGARSHAMTAGTRTRAMQPLRAGMRLSESAGINNICIEYLHTERFAEKWNSGRAAMLFGSLL